MALDFIVNSGNGLEAHGDVAHLLMETDFDPSVLRPFYSKTKKSGRFKGPYVTLNNKRVLVSNAPATLRKDEWKMLDDAVMDAVYTTPMRLFADLRARTDAIIIPNGMGKTIYEYQRASDIGPATTSMDGIREGDSDRPHFDLTGIPLPIVHKDFQFSLRQLRVSRQGGAPLDTMMPRLAARKCLEEVEKYTAGSQTYKYGGYNVYGFANFPQRMTQSITAPASNNHPTTIAEILSMRKKLTDKGYTGPFRIYMAPGWDTYLDQDYIDTGVRSDTFRERIRQIEGITDISISYWLTGNTILMVQQTSDVAQAVVGMDVTTIQWPEKGGMMQHFKVLCILVPLLRADFNGVTGIVHGS